MNAPLPEVVLQLDSSPAQARLALASDGVLRYVCHSRWGDMLIEVRDGSTFVNGQKVEPAAETRQPL